MTGYQVVPIGWVESPLKDRAQAPRQGDEGAPDAWLVFQPEVAEGLRDLGPGAEIIVLTWLDRAARDVLVTRPRTAPAACALEGGAAARSCWAASIVGGSPKRSARTAKSIRGRSSPD